MKAAIWIKKSKMRPLLFLFWVFSTVGVATDGRAENWLEYERKDGRVFAVDTESVEGTKEHFTANFLVTRLAQPLAPVVQLYVIIATEIDCTTDSARILGGQVYLSDGNAVGKPIPGDERLQKSKNEGVIKLCTSWPSGAGTSSARRFLKSLGPLS